VFVVRCSLYMAMAWHIYLEFLGDNFASGLRRLKPKNPIKKPKNQKLFQIKTSVFHSWQKRVISG